jgi:hypothetical protein
VGFAERDRHKILIASGHGYFRRDIGNRVETQTVMPSNLVRQLWHNAARQLCRSGVTIRHSFRDLSESDFIDKVLFYRRLCRHFSHGDAVAFLPLMNDRLS